MKAVVVAAAFLLAACSSTTEALHQVTPSPSAPVSASASPSPSPSPSTSPVQVPLVPGGNVLISMRMTSLSVMWAATNNHVLRSTDSGRHWADVTPHGQSDWAAFFAVDDGAAWVIHSDFNAHVYSVWRTVDAGQTWHSFTGRLPGGGVTNVYFIDRQHGWITDNLGAAAGSEGVAIVRSTDGGANWTVVAQSNDPTTNQGKSGIEFGCDKGAAVFGNTEVGLLTTYCAGGPPLVYRTTDGGYTWRGESLPNVPSTQYGGGAENATFLSPTDAIIETEYYDNGPVYGLLATRDGGATWSAYRLPGGGTVDFESIFSGWQMNDTLFATTDGGRTWHTTGSPLPFKGTGLTLQYLGKGIAAAFSWRGTTAYRTDDGGRTWRSVAPGGLSA